MPPRSERRSPQVLYDDLDFEREFYLIPRDTYASIPAAQPGGQIPFASWRELGADGVVSGTVQRNGDNLRVDVRLFSIRIPAGGLHRRAMTAPRGALGSSRTRSRTRSISSSAGCEVWREPSWPSSRTATASALVGTVEKREVKEVYIVDYDGANPSADHDEPQSEPESVLVARRAARSHTPATTLSAPDIVVSRIYEGLLQRPAKGQGNNYLPVFSPDGTRIAFMSTRDGNAEIYVMNVDGSNLRRLTNHPADDVTPTWSPSGGQIAFTSDRSGRPQIYIMNADGTGVARITNETEADRPTWSPAPYNEIAFTARDRHLVRHQDLQRRHATGDADHRWPGIEREPGVFTDGTASGVHLDPHGQQADLHDRP